MSATLAWTMVSLSRVRLSIPRRTRLVADAGAASETIAARERMIGKTRRLNSTAPPPRGGARIAGTPKWPRRGTAPLGVTHTTALASTLSVQGLARWATPVGNLVQRQTRARGFSNATPRLQDNFVECVPGEA